MAFTNFSMKPKVMSSFDKVVKLACKPKAAPPKAKYVDTIIAATWSDDGAIHDVCKALAPRFREPNIIVVFKALIVLHTMIRNGATDNVLGYLSNSDVLRLRNVSGGSWDGYTAPENLQNYAIYLDSRIRAYRDLKHDAIRVQAETNRDMRNSAYIEHELGIPAPSKKGKSTLGKNAPPASASTSSGPTRSRTIMGRKLRVMTVEKGLLRETKAVHRMIDALVECRFYLDNLEDELSITALQMLVKDLLILFQAGNEGVINVLEHYFEMSHVDATEALTIYRHFCKQTERVVEFLGVAKKLQNLLNVPIPNLKHAPVSLAGALQEYLEDPAFEQNRIEYKASKQAADKGTKAPVSSKQGDTSAPKAGAAPPTQTSVGSSASGSTPAPALAKSVDFFSAIEEEQPTMFNPQTNSPSTAYFQNQSVSNPFARMQMTGQPFMQAQPTGFVQPQQTGLQMNPFSLQQLQSAPPPVPSFPAQPMQSQPTGFTQPQQPQATGFGMAQPSASFSSLRPTPQGSLLPQATGVNPFRQSMLVPQTTGMQLFGVGGSGAPLGQAAQSPFPSQGQTQAPGSSVTSTQPFTSTGVAFSTSSISSPFAQTFQAGTPLNVPARPSSTPLTSIGPTSNSATSPPVAQPVKTHQTGTKNPFGPITPAAPPPLPKQPTLMELSMGMSGLNMTTPQQAQSPQQTQSLQQPSSMQNGFNAFNSGALGPGLTDISSVASSFAFSTKTNDATNGSQASSSNVPPTGALNSQPTANSTVSSAFSDSIWSSLSSQPTGTTNTTSSVAPMKPQMTGFAGLKPFKPSSSFGASLMDSLPPIPGSSSGTPAPMTNTGTAPSSTPATSPGVNGASPFAGFSTSSQPTPTSQPFISNHTTGAIGSFSSGSTLGQGLRPQITGGGAANPFRASMMTPNGTSGTSSIPPVPSLPLSSMGSQPFSSNLLNGFGSSSTFGQNSQQQQNSASLI
ncbi:hypothetical protein H0H92_006271 [Tricholoma furcatifolium]|nr:hypothetical protein H0H92_006271 [Tricholoma furcatifolium]